VTSFFGIKGAFFRERQDGSAPFFSEFSRKHLFIATCIKQQCTRTLSFKKLLLKVVFSQLFSQKKSSHVNCFKKTLIIGLYTPHNVSIAHL